MADELKLELYGDATDLIRAFEQGGVSAKEFLKKVEATQKQVAAALKKLGVESTVEAGVIKTAFGDFGATFKRAFKGINVEAENTAKATKKVNAEIRKEFESLTDAIRKKLKETEKAAAAVVPNLGKAFRGIGKAVEKEAGAAAQAWKISADRIGAEARRIAAASEIGSGRRPVGFDPRSNMTRVDVGEARGSPARLGRAAAAGGFEAQAKAAGAPLQSLADTAKAVARDLAEDFDKAWKEVARDADRSIEKTEKDLRELGVAADRAAKKLADGATAGARKAADGIQRAGKSAAATAQRLDTAFLRAGQAIESSIFNARNALLGLGVGLAIKAPIKAAADFETALSKLAIVANDSGTPVEELRQKLVALSKTTSVPLLELTQGLTDSIGRLPKGSDQAAKGFDILKEAQDAARASGGDVIDIVRGITAVMNTYGSTGITAADVNDKFFATFDQGGASVTELAGSIGQITGLAANLKIPLDSLFGSIAVLTRAGQTGGEAITNYRQLLVSLTHPPEVVKKKLEALGLVMENGEVIFSNAGVALHGVEGVLKQLEERGAVPFLGELLTDVQGRLAATTILSTGLNQLDDDTQRLAKSGGRAAQAVLELKDDFNEAAGVLKNEFTVAMIEAGNRVLPALIDGIKRLSDFLRVNKDALAEGFEKLVKFLVKLGAFVGDHGITILKFFGALLAANRIGVFLAAFRTFTDRVEIFFGGLAAKAAAAGPAIAGAMGTAGEQSGQRFSSGFGNAMGGLGRLVSKALRAAGVLGPIILAAYELGDAIGTAVGKRMTAAIDNAAAESAIRIEELSLKIETRLGELGFANEQEQRELQKARRQGDLVDINELIGAGRGSRKGLVTPEEAIEKLGKEKAIEAFQENLVRLEVELGKAKDQVAPLVTEYDKAVKAFKETTGRLDLPSRAELEASRKRAETGTFTKNERQGVEKEFTPFNRLAAVGSALGVSLDDKVDGLITTKLRGAALIQTDTPLSKATLALARATERLDQASKAGIESGEGTGIEKLRGRIAALAFGSKPGSDPSAPDDVGEVLSKLRGRGGRAGGGVGEEATDFANIDVLLATRDKLIAEANKAADDLGKVSADVAKANSEARISSLQDSLEAEFDLRRQTASLETDVDKHREGILNVERSRINEQAQLARLGLTLQMGAAQERLSQLRDAAQTEIDVIKTTAAKKATELQKQAEALIRRLSGNASQIASTERALAKAREKDDPRNVGVLSAKLERLRGYNDDVVIAEKALSDSITAINRGAKKESQIVSEKATKAEIADIQLVEEAQRSLGQVAKKAAEDQAEALRKVVPALNEIRDAAEKLKEEFKGLKFSEDFGASANQAKANVAGLRSLAAARFDAAKAAKDLGEAEQRAFNARAVESAAFEVDIDSPKAAEATKKTIEAEREESQAKVRAFATAKIVRQQERILSAEARKEAEESERLQSTFFSRREKRAEEIAKSNAGITDRTLVEQLAENERMRLKGPTFEDRPFQLAREIDETAEQLSIRPVEFLAPKILAVLEEGANLLLDGAIAGGEALLGAIQTGVDLFQQYVIAPLSDAIAGPLQMAGGALGDALGALGTLDQVGVARGPSAQTVLSQGFANAQRLSGKLADQLPNLAGAFMQGLTTILPGLIAEAASTFGAVLNVVADNIGPLLTSVIGAIFDAVPTIVSALVEAIPKFVTALLEAATQLIGELPKFLDTILSGVVDLIPKIIDSLVKTLPGLIQAVAVAIPKLITVLAERVPEIIDALVVGLPKIVTAIVAALPQIIGAIIRTFPRLFVALVSLIPKILFSLMKIVPLLVAALIEGLGAGLLDIFKEIKDFLFGGFLTGGGDPLAIAGVRSAEGREAVRSVQAQRPRPSSNPAQNKNVQKQIRDLLAVLKSEGITQTSVRFVAQTLGLDEFTVRQVLGLAEGQGGTGIGRQDQIQIRHQGGMARAAGGALATAMAWAKAGVPRFAFGGLVEAPGAQAQAAIRRVLRGDEVPSILQAGEGVLSRVGMRVAGGESNLAQMNRGQQPTSVQAPKVDVRIVGNSEVRAMMALVLGHVAVDVASSSGQVRREVNRLQKAPLMTSFVRRG